MDYFWDLVFQLWWKFSTERDLVISSNIHLYLILINYCNNEAGQTPTLECLTE